MKKNVLFIGISVSLLILLGIGVSYSMWNMSNTQDTENVISTTECFDISITSQENSISLKNSYPISDEKGKKLTPFTFKVTNTCDMAASYSVNLESLKGSTLSSSFLKVMVNNKVPKMLNQYDSASTVNNGSVEARVLDTGTLFKNKSKTYEIRLWIDYDTTMEDLDNETKVLKSKIVVTSSPTNEEEPTYLVDKITELSSADTVNIATDDPDNNIRYIGANPDNYVYFNCSDYNNQSDNTCEKWRIIGVFNNATKSDGTKENLVKIIRDERIGDYLLDYNTKNDWSISSLQTLLNQGAYYNVTTGNYYTYDNVVGNLLDMSVDFTLIGLKSGITKNAIEEVVWNLGGVNSSSLYPSEFYTGERGPTVYSGRSTTWTGKIGLMYPSDYGYATAGGTTTDRLKCLSTKLSSWNNYSECYNNDYLFKSDDVYWTLTSHLTNVNAVFTVYRDGRVESFYTDNNIGVRPTLYLKSNITIKDGNGSSSSPYQLGL